MNVLQIFLFSEINTRSRKYLDLSTFKTGISLRIYKMSFAGLASSNAGDTINSRQKWLMLTLVSGSGAIWLFH